MQSETSSSSLASPAEEPTLPIIKNPRTIFAEFPEGAKRGREFVTQLKTIMPVGIYSINAPTKNGGCKVAVQIDASRTEDVAKLVADMKGSLGTVVVPPQQRAPKPAPAPTPDTGAAEGETPMPAKKKKATAKKSAKGSSGPRSTSKATAGKTKCKAEGHGSYIDIKWHNEKWHNGKAV